MERGKVNCIMGGQAGSEAKGKLSAFLAQKFGISTFAGCLSPNAGHTVIDNDGSNHVTHHIPVGVYGSRQHFNSITVFVGASSVVHPKTLYGEIEDLIRFGIKPSNIIIDSRVAVIEESHMTMEERNLLEIGSTAQGVGEARVSKLRRDRRMIRDFPLVAPFVHDRVNSLIMEHLNDGQTILYEMGQGFDLCIDHGIDPKYCTSRIVNPMAAMAEIGIPAKFLGDVYSVIRAYPIRVNNRSGSSGPYPSDELTWDEIQCRCNAPMDITEYTTTTKLVRRVFEFSLEQIRYMVSVCNPTYLCFQFANYIDWECFGVTNVHDLGEPVLSRVTAISNLVEVPVAYIGTGPKQFQMVDMGIDTLEGE